MTSRNHKQTSIPLATYQAKTSHSIAAYIQELRYKPI